MKLIVSIEITDPRADTLAVKEALAYYCEQYGDIRMVRVEEVMEKQESLFGGRYDTKRNA